MNANTPLPLTPPHRLGSPPWVGLSVLLLAGFVTIFDLFVVNVAIPSLQTGLNASFAQIGFIVAGYELAFGVLLITGGAWGTYLAVAGCSSSVWQGLPWHRRYAAWRPVLLF